MTTMTKLSLKAIARRSQSPRAPMALMRALALQNNQTIVPCFTKYLSRHNGRTPNLLSPYRQVSQDVSNAFTTKAETPSPRAQRNSQIYKAQIDNLTSSSPSLRAQRNTQIYKAQIGSLTTEQWKDAIGNLIDNLTRSTRTEDVKESFRLLQRLVDEYSTTPAPTQKELARLKVTDLKAECRQRGLRVRGTKAMLIKRLLQDSSALNTDILKKVVLNWKSWRKSQPTAQDLGPEEVLAMVDDFKIRVVAMQPDVPIYNAIMAAVSTEGKGPKSLAQRVQQVFDRIVQPASKSYETLMRAYIQAGDIETTIKIMDRVLRAAKKRKIARFGSPIFEEALAACVNAKDKRGGLLAEDILDRMHKFDQADLLAHKRSDVVNYNSAINAWAKSNHPQAAENAERILQYLKQESWIQPDTVTYSSVMDTWAQQGNAEQATMLLSEMYDLYLNGNKHVKPDIRSFTIVLHALAKSKVENAGIKAEKQLQLMWELHDMQGGNDFKPNVHSYTCVIDAWAGSGHPEAGSRAEDVFSEMLQRSEMDCDLVPTTVSVSSLANALVKAGNVDRAVSVVDNMCLQYEQGVERLRPNVQTFSIIIDGIARKGGRNAGRKAEDLLRKMEKLGVPPNAVSYTSTIHAWSHSGGRQAAQAATRLLREILDKAKDDPDMKPDVRSFNSAIDAWAKSGHRTAGIKAGKLLREMVVKGRDDPDVKPNAKSFNSAIDAWAKSGQPNAGIQAETLLQKMMVQGRNNPDIKPDVRSYTSAINAWAKSGLTSAGVEAERLLREMVFQGKDNPDMKPNVTSFSSAIDAWAKSGQQNAGVEAERLLREMMVQGRDNPDVKPNVRSFSSAINAWATSGHCNAGVQAERLLREMMDQGGENPDMKPDATSFNSAIDAWAKSGHRNAGVEAEKILHEMMVQGTVNPDMKPDATSFNSAVHSWAKSGHPNAGIQAEKLILQMTVQGNVGPDMKPDAISFNSAIDAWAKSGHHNAGVQAERLLREMIATGRDNPGMKPNARSFNSAINAWATSGHHGAGVGADKLLREMALKGREDPEMKPDVTSFSSAINAWARSGHPNAGVEAEKLLREMIVKGIKNPNMKPNVRSYASAINAWASGGNLERAETLLLEMVNSKDKATQPNVISFNSVINALSKSPQLNKGDRADQYLQDMESLHKKGMQNMRPDLATYTTVLKCWSLSKDNPKAKRRLQELDAIIEGFKKEGGLEINQDMNQE